MTELYLAIGNKNYSSWSLRGWLAVKMTGAPFEEVMIPLDQPDTASRIAAFSPSGKVPALRHGRVVIWDSLAIGEYLAETFPDAHLWPADREARAIARACAAEMHSSFAALRTNMPMNIRNNLAGRGRAPGVEADIERIQHLWMNARQYASRGDFLFGEFSLADAFYAPVVTRFKTYGVQVAEVSSSYMEAVLAHPFMKEWIEAAKAEKASLPKYD
jgi:glutathione S-transferase